MSQMKGQYKTPEKQLNEVEIDNHPEKRIQNNDSEDDPESLAKNGEDAKNVCKRHRRNKEQTNRDE